MKAKEIREMSAEEQQGKLVDLKQTLFNLRFQLEVGQLENPRKILETKHDIARIKTIMRESELSRT
ncbi:MAG: 50S ribosomal protein L29 [Deltaproteobacteria bacterium]|nr:MAG: 50S ribosomal protein L29 [Deltaproteobacteria bacterium]